MARVTRDELIDFQRQLKTDAAIGVQLGISRQAVHQLRVKFGVFSLTKKNAGRNSEIQQEYLKGVPGTELARRYNLSVSQTYRIINEIKVGERRPEPEAKVLEQILDGESELSHPTYSPAAAMAMTSRAFSRQ